MIWFVQSFRLALLFSSVRSLGGASFVMVLKSAQITHRAPHIFVDAMMWGSRRAHHVPEQVCKNVNSGGIATLIGRAKTLNTQHKHPCKNVI